MPTSRSRERTASSKRLPHRYRTTCARRSRRSQAKLDSSRYRCRRRADRKSTRLNSSHVKISYAVFCLHPPPTSIHALSLHDALPICSLPDVLSMPSQRQLRDANESLARANRELEAFTASVSHDLRSPLTTIAGQAGLLEISMPQAS